MMIDRSLTLVPPAYGGGDIWEDINGRALADCIPCYEAFVMVSEVPVILKV